MNPLVCAIVLNHNGSRWLDRCLRSLLATDYPRLKILLVDNASTDDSLAVARAVSGEMEFLCLPDNVGFTAANNTGIARALQSGANYVALLNNDTWFEPAWLRLLVEVGEANPGIGVLGPVQLTYDGRDFNSWTTTAAAHLPDRLRQGRSPGDWLPIPWVEGSGLVVRRQVLEKIGRLDPIFEAFFEECDFCRRARGAGFEVALVPASEMHHYRGGTFDGARFSKHREYLLMRNSMIYNSTDPGRSLPSNLWALARNNATHLSEALRKRRLAVWLRASLSALRLLPALYSKWRRDRRLIFSTD